MNLGDMVTEVAANGFDPQQFGRQRLVNFINDGYQYICTSVNYTGNEAVLDFTTAAGTALYPQPANASDIRSLRDTARHRQLASASLRDMDRATTSTGIPSRYALDGSKLRLWPTPDGAYTLECRYWQIPAPLVADTDVPTLIPSPWHWLIWTWAVAQAFRAEDDVQRAQSWDARFDKGLQSFAASMTYWTDMPSVAGSMWSQGG